MIELPKYPLGGFSLIENLYNIFLLTLSKYLLLCTSCIVSYGHFIHLIGGITMSCESSEVY